MAKRKNKSTPKTKAKAKPAARARAARRSLPKNSNSEALDARRVGASDASAIETMGANLIALNAKYADYGILQLATLQQIDKIREDRKRRVREAGDALGLDMSLNWHFDEATMSFSPKP